MQLGSGCTSGHMLCGLARFSYRSFIATLSFFSVALLTAQLFPAALPLAATTFTTPSVLSLSTLALLQLPFLVYTLGPLLFSSQPATAELLTSFFIGMHFTFGLALAGMTAPSKVLSFFYLPLPFLPLAGQRAWDPSLAMVAIGGLLPNVLAWRSIKGWKKPLWKEKWDLPTRKNVDWKLVVGSAMFGVGWGELDRYFGLEGRRTGADLHDSPRRSSRYLPWSSARQHWRRQLAECRWSVLRRFRCRRAARWALIEAGSLRRYSNGSIG